VGGMAKIRDRTEDFKDAVRHTAVSLGYNEVKKKNCFISSFKLCFAEFCVVWMRMWMWLLFDRPNWQPLWRPLSFINHGKGHRLLKLLLKRFV
jgi:hypothetical protein